MNFIHDFNNSSKCWRENKIKMGNGYFNYKCNASNCEEPLYCYTTQHKLFLQFASSFDLENKNNPNQYYYCENHLQNIKPFKN